jgi:fatty-acid desaturase
MSFFIAFLQIGELFNGNFNWRGVFHLFLFILMGFIVVGFAAFVGYQAFRSSEKGEKDDV